ncbi:MAG: hypothetical protein DLM73_03330 [Chthoniobacterales bacterium]|nr:MAG: hypothetical protein DLM73_03330 [Chthoniobacterales bacterium]
MVLLLPATPRVEARTDISVDFFYDNLGSGGNWVEVGDYGYCWQPTISVSNRSWRPYSDGYWAYTDVGWTWVSYEDFGWATYHYGRWTRVRDRGWFWVPGREWAPAWVSWRTGGDYIGWAPLPPRGGGEVVYDNRPINAQVDIDFDIGPDYYNFVDIRYIGEPVLRERIIASDRNVTYISSTVNVTNITYSNNQVYNYGPDYNRVSRYSARPIQRLTLEREANVDVSAAARSNALMKVQGDKLVVAAPQVLIKPPSPIAPKVVKEKITAPTFEHGWTGDAKAEAELKQKIKAEDPKAVAPPTVKPRDGAEVTQSPAASPAAATATATPASSATCAAASPSPAKDKGKDKGRDNVSPAPHASASVSPAASPALTPDKSKNKRNEKPAPGTTSASSLAPSTSSTPPPNKPEKLKKAPVTPPSDTSKAAEKSAAPSAAPSIRPTKRDVVRPTPLEPATPETDLPNQNKSRKISPPPEPKPQTAATPETKSKQQPFTQERPAPPTRDIQPDSPAKRPMPHERVVPPPGPAANAPVNPPEKSHGKDEGKKKNEPATSPTP